MAVAVKHASVVGAVAVFDYHMAIGVAMGFVAGWAARAARAIEKRQPREDILRDLTVSLLIFGGSVITVLYVVDKLHLEPLEAALLSFAVSWAGIAGLSMVADSVLGWVRALLDKLGRRE